MTDNTQVLAAIGGKEIIRVAAENLGGAFQKPILWSGQEAGERKPGIVDTIFAADEIVGYQRPVDE